MRDRCQLRAVERPMSYADTDTEHETSRPTNSTIA